MDMNPSAPHVRTVEKYEGYLEAYWEQGWEGFIRYALSIEGLDHPFFLENGQRLTIYAEDGSILWSGILRFVKRRWWDNHNLPYGVWSDVKQAGVSYAQWIAWFMHEPPLKATVEIKVHPGKFGAPEQADLVKEGHRGNQSASWEGRKATNVTHKQEAA